MVGTFLCNGTGDRIGYTALLNTQGDQYSVVFKFTVARMRELDDCYEVLDSMIITITSGIPSNHDGFNNTIHCDSETIPKRKEISLQCLYTMVAQLGTAQQM